MSSTPSFSASTTERHTVEEQARKYACDRCRGQKLRCIPIEGSKTSCKRCLQAKVVCVSVPPSRMGRPPGSGSGRAAAGDRSARLRNGTQSIGTVRSEEITSENEHGSWSQTSLLSKLPDAGLEGALLPGKRSREDCGTPASLSERRRTWHKDTAEGLQTASGLPRAPMDPNTSPSIFEDDSAGFDLDNWTMPGSANFADDHMDHIFGLSTTPERSIGAAQPNGRKVHDNDRGAGPSISLHSHMETFEYQREQTKPREDMDMGNNGSSYQRSNHTQCPLPESDHWTNGISQLSELNIYLSRQLQRVNTGSWKFNNNFTEFESETSQSCADTVADLFSSSEKLLKLINRFAPASMPPGSCPTLSDAFTASPTMSTFDNQSDDRIISSISGITGSPSPLTSSASETARMRGGAGVSRANISLLNAPAKTDTPTMLLILTCYLHLTRMYSTLLSNIHNSLLSFRSTATPLPAPLPSLRIGSFSLHPYPNLQVTILLEVSVHLLGQFEEALGLPYECRVRSRPEGGGRDGSVSSGCIIGGSGPTKWMETLMRLEQSERETRGTGDTMPLKELVVSVRRLLQSSSAL